jgi:hypothetical protein
MAAHIPTHALNRIYSEIVLSDNVVDGVVEESDKTGDVHNGEGLASEETKDYDC